MSVVVPGIDTHLHTAYSDGRDSLPAMVEAAAGLGLRAFAVTDHVWASTDWFDAYVAELLVVRKQHRGRTHVLIGLEAKALDLNGTLDANESFFRHTDLVIGSFHGIPTPSGLLKAKDLPEHLDEAQAWWMAALEGLLANPHVNVLGHLGAEFAALGVRFTDSYLDRVAEQVRRSGKVVEVNLKHRVPLAPLLHRLIEGGVLLTLASDSHSVDDLRQRSREAGAFLTSTLGPQLGRVRWAEPEAFQQRLGRP